MNKIDKKLVNKINEWIQLPGLDLQSTEWLTNIKEYLLGNLSDYCSQLFDYFESIGIFLSIASLDAYESGYILTKLLQYNCCMIIDSKPYTYMRIDQYQDLLKKNGIDTQENFEKILIDYFDKKLPDSLSKLLQDIFYKEEAVRIKNLNLYQKFQLFMNKQNKTDEDYEEARKDLEDLLVPEYLINCLFVYLKSQKLDHKKEFVKNEESKNAYEEIKYPTRKVLKQQLKCYYDEKDLLKSFDYANYEKVVYLLKGLNYAENQIRDILSVLLRNKIANYSYYKYIFTKYASKFPNDPILDDILESSRRMFLLDDVDDYAIYKEYILENMAFLEQAMIDNFDYDLKRIYSNQLKN